jgi:hypothetical protein
LTADSRAPDKPTRAQVAVERGTVDLELCGDLARGQFRVGEKGPRHLRHSRGLVAGASVFVALQL